MKDKYNFRVDFANQKVSIEVSTAIFPVPVILHTAYHFIDEGKVIVKESKQGKVVITLIPEKNPTKESDLENLAYEFNIQLISSFVENTESERHAKLRDEMMKAALSPQRPSFPIPPRERPPQPENHLKKGS